jgi:outer membrane protein OmpA-like peptidoglycan-associated protein
MERTAMPSSPIAPRHSSRLLLPAALALGLAACTTALPPDKVEAIGGPFNENLKEGYLRLADGQWSDFHLDEWHHFQVKAHEAMLGDTVWPDKVGGRGVQAGQHDQALAMRERLVRVLESGGRASAPDEAAAAQVGFDCWLEELERYTDPASFSDCQEVAQASLARAEASLIHTPYRVYFERGSDQLDPNAMNQVTRAAQAAYVAEPRTIAVTGYADASGSASDNQALSRRRAEAVAEALRKSGVANGDIRVGARGALAGASEREARRVEISFDG